GLGDITVLGNLFKYQTRKREKTNLLVFLRPIILKTNEQSNALVTDRYEYIRNMQQTVQPNPDAPLPSMGKPALSPLDKAVPQDGKMFAKPVPPAPARVSTSDSSEK
ncbi:MAG: type II secretion system protein GspD, partial [Burkholderiales bacterium]|nr:type II secretion system protein GspD [Burkholderiales bacterium]